MGFCRRCGDIVAGVRCKCGGLAVGPSVNFSQATVDHDKPDVWSRTYVRSTAPTPSPPRERSSTLPSSSRPFPRPSVDFPKFPRPQSSYFPRSSLGGKVSSHIESTLSRHPLTPAKASTKGTEDGDGLTSPDVDILSDPNTSTLSKAYGSVLQPKESLTTFTCFICFTIFPPDATIYPDPADPTTTTRFLCKPCFTVNGGAKGDCQACSRPILIISSEGGFVENAGRIWHKRCFRCDGCFKDISDTPMVDLLGRPSCEDCFDSCLGRPLRESPSPRRLPETPESSQKRSNLGGMKGGSREGSPAIEELHLRLGIKSRESTPFPEIPTPSNRDASPIISDLSQRLSNLSTSESAVGPDLKNIISEGGPSKTANTTSPTRGRYERFRLSNSKSPKIVSPSPRVENNPVAEIERRLMRQSYAGSPSLRSISPVTSFSRDSISVAPSTPDLTDFSDNNTNFSAPSTPQSTSPPQPLDDVFSQRTPNKTPVPPTSRANVTPSKMALSSPSTPCGKCSKPLFRTQSGGKFVTVPEESAKRLPPKSFHVECFRCAVCDESFEETKNGQAVFVRSSSGCCHVSCATPERIVIRPLKTKSSSISVSSSPSPSPSKPERPPKSAPSSISSFPRFGSGSTCPGCRISVSPMERGVVPGPQGSRWHASCLICGGKGVPTGPRRDPSTPGCGKRLDSAAKTDGEGGVWCRECMLLVPTTPHSPSRQESSLRPITPSHTGGNSFNRFPAPGVRRNEGIAPQLTGTTTIAKQFTGMTALTSQLTGGGLSPTRQLGMRPPSPTKMMMGGGRRTPFPRPKSVVGMRGKSVDEGRGMYLVRQMTGGGVGSTDA
ncbi:hypothetical protein DFH11DRAFT_1558333 [Phellopilus nigrolimitatus]|nr:hypothetical protein DFH11DRAFT_1558333 [Phellopilus nigrolimitatus]